MAVLSHGDEGQVYGKDGVIQIKKLVEPLKHCQTLHGKPKLFFIQVSVSLQWVLSLFFFVIIVVVFGIVICVNLQNI